MKRLTALLLLLLVILFGCYTHINKVKDKWGPPAKVEDRGIRLSTITTSTEEKAPVITPATEEGLWSVARR